MWDIKELYNEVITEHGKKPRNFRLLETANRNALGHNQLCGDKLRIFLQLDGSTIKDISFLGEGCAFSRASASMMTQRLKGKSQQEAEQLFNEFHRMATGMLDSEKEEHNLGHLTIFATIRNRPERVKCVTLPWHTMYAALHGQEETSTEGTDTTSAQMSA
jgi:nitrogen fixation protein NifU and related proteins